jgi:hypothetical protein
MVYQSPIAPNSTESIEHDVFIATQAIEKEYLPRQDHNKFLWHYLVRHYKSHVLQLYRRFLWQQAEEKEERRFQCHNLDENTANDLGLFPSVDLLFDDIDHEVQTPVSQAMRCVLFYSFSNSRLHTL